MAWNTTQGSDRRPARSAPPIRLYGRPNANTGANHAAYSAMSECERQTGKTAEQLRDEMQAQRARVLDRYLDRKAA